jgi:hypothetical protein
MTLEDGFSVFQKIKSSSKYWQQAKYELLAKQNQLGPLKFFFTLSCADKLWPETFSTICSHQGYNVHISVVHVDHEESKVYTGQVTVNGIPMEEFLESQNLHQLIQEDILTVTRVFDNRLRMMIRHIVNGPSNPMHVSNYNYRIEFQMRGMPHAHGVLWTNLTEQQREAMDHIYSTEFEVGDNHYNVVVKYIDAHVTCSTDIDDDLARLVLKVQVHHHTWVCRRPEKMCRFGYPRMPSDFTIIAKPLPVDMDAQESKDITKKYSTTLELVKHVLNNELPDNLSIQGLCDIAGVDMHDYYAALQVSRKGVVIVLKRSVKDRYVNNYNARWLRAWQGNMDIQLCPD